MLERRWVCMGEVMVAAFAVALLASLAMTITGFGYALVSVPLLALVVGPVEAVVATTMVSFLMSAWVGVRDRAEVSPGVTRRFTIAAVVGMPLGLALLTQASERVLTFTIGAGLLLVLALFSIDIRLPSSSSTVLGAGLVSGALLTSTGMNGPPAVLTVDALFLTPRSGRATLQAIFVAQDIVAIAAFAVLGRASVEVFAIVGGSLLALPLGWFVGEQVFRRMSRAHFEMAMRLMLLATAAVAMVGSWSA